MRRFRGAWQSLNFDKEYLFGFETLVFATSGILSMHNQLVTLQRENKNLKLHHMTPLNKMNAVFLHILKADFDKQFWNK